MKFLAIPLLAAMCASAANWTDRKEYDLVLNIRAESSPQKRLELLDRWKSAYPKSALAQDRMELYLAAYQALGDGPNMLHTAGELLSAQPDSLVGAYWFALLLPEQKAPAPELLALGEKAGNLLLAGPKSQAGVEMTARRALGWVHWQRSEYGPAEEEFRQCLQLDPASAGISAWLGTVLALQQQPEKRAPALWQLARASAYRDAGGLPDGQRLQIGAVLERLYTSYHGDASGLDRLRSATAAAPFPPTGFDIESAASAALRKHDEELSRLDPQMAAWIRVREKLQSPDGDKYFSESLHGNPLPALQGTLINADPPDQPQELTIGILDPAKPEIVIRLDSAFPNAADLGTVLQFEGTADSYAKDPFLLTVVSDRSTISGWPAPPKARKGKQ
jgi:tetratricopeptide (TPR) repeat protein